MRLKRSIKIMMGDGLMKHPLQAVRAAVVLACIALVSANVRPAQAQEFSNKPIRIIVGLVAGGATDVTARLIAQKLSASMHTNVYVENRPGAAFEPALRELTDRKSTRLNSSHLGISYAVFCLKKKKKK